MDKQKRLGIELYEEKLSGMIHTVRGVQVMLDSDLALLYGVETKIFNQSVKRNIERFPESFRFRLTPEEYELLRSQIVTSSTHGGRRYLPYAFTEQGVAMLSAVLRSETAIQTSISIINAFVGMRRYLAENAVILHRLESVMLSIARAWSGHTFSREKMKTREFCENNAPRKLYTLLCMLG